MEVYSLLEPQEILVLYFFFFYFVILIYLIIKTTTGNSGQDAPHSRGLQWTSGRVEKEVSSEERGN